VRIRQVKPSFFKDARIAEMTPAVRLTYIGLWMLADDAGYYRWDPAEAGLELYGYESRTKRERDVTAHLARLVEAGRVADLKCGHIVIPTLKDHQRFGGPTKRVLTYEREHLTCAPPKRPAPPRDSPPIPDPVWNGSGNGTERNVDGTVDPRERETEEERIALLDAYRRQGLPA
jgi:hypothetical protein